MTKLWPFVAAIALASPSVLAETTLKHDDCAGVALYYKVVTPRDYDPAKEYPAVIAFPGGEQSMPTVDGMLGRNLGARAAKHELFPPFEIPANVSSCFCTLEEAAAYAQQFQ